MFLNLAVNGVMLGSLYGLIAMGFILIFKATGVFNLAQGELVMIGGFFFWWSLSILGLSPVLAVLLALVFATLLAVGIEKFTMRPLIGEPVLSVVMMTMAISMILRGGSLIIWNPDVKSCPSIFPQNYITLGSVSIAPYLLAGFLLSLLMLLFFWLFFAYTQLGLKMRCVSDNQVGAQSIGISISRIMTATWIISCSAATLGAIIFVSGIGTVSVDLAEVALKAFAVGLLAGLESLPGALIAGAIVGVGEILASFYIDPLVGGGMGELFPFLVMMAILMIRPHGLFGLKKIERV